MTTFAEDDYPIYETLEDLPTLPDLYLYLVERTDETDYDETISIVLRACSADRALELAVETKSPYWTDRIYQVYEGFESDGSNLIVTLIGISTGGDEGLVIENFLHG